MSYQFYLMYIYILLDVLIWIIAEYFYGFRCFRWGESKYKQQVEILSDQYYTP